MKNITNSTGPTAQPSSSTLSFFQLADIPVSERWHCAFCRQPLADCCCGTVTELAPSSAPANLGAGGDGRLLDQTQAPCPIRSCLVPAPRYRRAAFGRGLLLWGL